MRTKKITAAVVQASPAFLDLDASVDQCAALMAEAARSGADLIAFPETFRCGMGSTLGRAPRSRKSVIRAIASRNFLGFHPRSGLPLPRPAIESKSIARGAVSRPPAEP